MYNCELNGYILTLGNLQSDGGCANLIGKYNANSSVCDKGIDGTVRTYRKRT